MYCFSQIRIEKATKEESRLWRRGGLVVSALCSEFWIEW